MNELTKPKIEIHDGNITTSSLAVANFFEKKHKNVLQAIEYVLPYLSEPFGRLNFQPSTYQNSQNKTQPFYHLTRSGFAMIALGFTGEKAIKFREAYINRFDEMEAELNSKKLQKIEREFAQETYLPFPEQVVRPSLPVSLAVKHLHILGHYLDWNLSKMRRMIKAGELEGFQDERGFWRIYSDQITKLATS